MAALTSCHVESLAALSLSMFVTVSGCSNQDIQCAPNLTCGSDQSCKIARADGGDTLVPDPASAMCVPADGGGGNVSCVDPSRCAPNEVCCTDGKSLYVEIGCAPSYRCVTIYCSSQSDCPMTDETRCVQDTNFPWLKSCHN